MRLYKGNYRYLHKWNCWKKEQVHIESQDGQGDWGDVVKAQLEQLGGQEQQAQMGSPLSVSHRETSLRRDTCEIIIITILLFTAVKFTVEGSSKVGQVVVPSGQ